MVEALRRVFYSPPKGGNEKGVETVDQMAAMPAQGSPGARVQTSLAQALQAGIDAATRNARQSSQVGQSDQRNFDRGRLPAQAAGDTSNFGAYDYEANHGGVAYGRGDPGIETNETPTPVIRPDTSMTKRYADGKPMNKLPVPANGNPGSYSKDATGGVRNNAKRP